MNIKYPRFYIVNEPSDFYVWYQESEYTRPWWSGWIKGNHNLWHKLNKMKKKDQQNAIIELATDQR